MDQAIDRAVRAIEAGMDGCKSPAEAAVYLWETRPRLVPRLEVMRRHKREPGMSDYLERLVGCIDEALEVGRVDMSTDPNDPSRRAEEMGQVITPRCEDTDGGVESDDDVPPDEASTHD